MKLEVRAHQTLGWIRDRAADDKHWVVMDEDTVKERVAAHEVKMAALYRGGGVRTSRRELGENELHWQATAARASSTILGNNVTAKQWRCGRP